MAENRKLPEIAKTVRLDFGDDDTRMSEGIRFGPDHAQ